MNEALKEWATALIVVIGFLMNIVVFSFPFYLAHTYNLFYIFYLVISFVVIMAITAGVFAIVEFIRKL